MSMSLYFLNYFFIFINYFFAYIDRSVFSCYAFMLKNKFTTCEKFLVRQNLREKNKSFLMRYVFISDSKVVD